MYWRYGFRRRHRGFERKAVRFLAFAGIVGALSCYRRIAD